MSNGIMAPSSELIRLRRFQVNRCYKKDLNAPSPRYVRYGKVGKRMKTLAATFRSDDFDFQKLRREGDIAIFVKQKPPFKFKSYEVVMIQKRDAYTWPNGQTTPAHEAHAIFAGLGQTMVGRIKRWKTANSRLKSLAEAQFEGGRLGTQLSLGMVFMHENRGRCLGAAVTHN